MSYISFFFFFNDTATTEIYTLSLHDALPISEALLDAGARVVGIDQDPVAVAAARARLSGRDIVDRKSTRLNSSHGYNSYGGLCLKKKKKSQTRENFGQRSQRGYPRRTPHEGS